VSGQPAGVTAALSAASIGAPGAATLNLTVASSAAAGRYAIAITGVGGNVTKTLIATLQVVNAAKPDFVIGINSKALSIPRGRSSKFTVQTVVTGSGVPSIALSVSGLPTGVTARFSPAAINGSGLSTVTLTAAATAKRATTPLTFSGTGAGITHSSTVNLTVN
jgi:uncharacterized membrane protein